MLGLWLYTYYIQTDRQAGRHTYIERYEYIYIYIYIQREREREREREKSMARTAVRFGAIKFESANKNAAQRRRTDELHQSWHRLGCHAKSQNNHIFSYMTK